jgi:hypothetical protein
MHVEMNCCDWAWNKTALIGCECNASKKSSLG